MKKLIYISLIFLILNLIITTNSNAQDIPEFKISGIFERAMSILVHPETSKEQLKSLITSFKRARENNSLEKLGILPTTPKGKKGPYAIILIYVFTEKEWASTDKLKRLFKTASEDPFAKEYKKHIKAHYFYNIISHPKEIGSIGYARGGESYTKEYEELFQTN